MELMPRCPRCGCVLDFFDHYDCYDDGSKIFMSTHGDCPQCHCNYKWTDVYVLHHFEDLDEDK